MSEADDDGQQAASVLRVFEERLEEAERSILSQHSLLLERWTFEQQLAIRRAAELDDESMRVRMSSGAACISAIRADVNAYEFQRSEAFRTASVTQEVRDRDFYDELCALGEARYAETMDLLRKACESLQHNSEELQEMTLENLERSLTAMLWRKARESLRGKSVPAGLAEESVQTRLQSVLDDERGGWARSQHADLERLHNEVDAESKDVLEQLRKRLEATSPSGVLNASQLQQLQEIAQVEKKRLETVERETCAAYASEIDATVHRCEEDYRGYDCELEQVVFRTLEQRYKSAEEMRQLKLALCRWRLDYQRAYHEHSASLAASPEPLENAKDRRERERSGDKDRDGLCRAQFQSYRRAVSRIWAEGKVPVSEMQRFVSRAVDVLARERLAVPILDLYHEELNQYGAMPLLEYASQPEVLDVWLGSLSRQRGSSSTNTS